MLKIKVLGKGCANCQRLEAIVKKVVSELGKEAEVEKVTDLNQIMEWDILSTPGLVINDTLVASGRIPSETEISTWVTNLS